MNQGQLKLNSAGAKLRLTEHNYGVFIEVNGQSIWLDRDSAVSVVMFLQQAFATPIATPMMVRAQLAEQQARQPARAAVGSAPVPSQAYDGPLTPFVMGAVLGAIAASPSPSPSPEPSPPSSPIESGGGGDFGGGGATGDY